MQGLAKTASKNLKEATGKYCNKMNLFFESLARQAHNVDFFVGFRCRVKGFHFLVHLCYAESQTSVRDDHLRLTDYI